MSEVGPEVPAALAISEEQLEAKEPVRMPLGIRNPGDAYLWINVSTEGPFARVHPAIITVAPGGTERITVTIDTPLITTDNHASGRIRLAWRELSTPGGAATGMRGEASVSLDLPRPRRRQTCPRSGCGATVRDGDPSCRHCGLLLRFCPTCGLANSRAESTCRSNSLHSLRRADPWPQIGGGPARGGAAGRSLPRRVSLAWRFQPPGVAECALGAPVVAHDTAFVVGTLPSGDGRLYALDIVSGSLLWEVRLPAGEAPHPDRGAPAVAGDGLYLATIGGFVIALESVSGRQRWVSRIPARVFPAVVAAADRVCIATTRADMSGGHLVTLRAADGAKISSCALDGRADTPPALVGATAFVTRDDQTVRAVDTNTGAPIWSQDAGGEFDAGPSVADGVVYAGTTGGDLLAVDAASGDLRWRMHLSDSAVETLPAVSEGRVYCATADGSVHTVSAGGKAVGAVSIGAQSRGAPVAGRDGLLLGAEDGRLYHTDGVQSLEVLYDVGRGRRISAPLCLAYPFLLFAATGGELFALKLEGG